MVRSCSSVKMRTRGKGGQMFGLFKQTNFIDDPLQQSKFFSLSDTSGALYNTSNGKSQNLISRRQNVGF